MSHFSVLVLGNNVEEQLAPYHEFECTGVDNEFVQDIDITEKVKEELAKNTVSMYRDPTGELHDKYSNKFYREPTAEEVETIGLAGTGSNGTLSWTSNDWNDGKGYRTMIHFCPEGWQKEEIKNTASLIEFAESWHGLKATTILDLNTEDAHKYGYCLVDQANEVIKIIKRTNPNSKWDYWRIGGRWAGMLKLKPGTTHHSPPNYGWEFKHDGIPVREGKYTDQAKKANIDFIGIKAKARENALKKYDQVHKLINFNQDFITWAEIDKEDIKKAREQYGKQSLIKEWNATAQSATDQELREIFVWDRPDEYTCEREHYAKLAEDAASRTFAIVKDGKWFEKGEMGWWATVSGEKDEETWNSIFWNMINNSPDDTLITVVDCHI